MKKEDIDYLNTLHKAGFLIQLPINSLSLRQKLHRVDYENYQPLDVDPKWLATVPLSAVRVYQLQDMTEELFGLHDHRLCQAS